MISLEKGLMQPENRARERIASYGSFLQQLDIILFAQKPFNESIAPNVRVLSTNSRSKFLYIADALWMLWKMRHERYDVVTAQDVVEMGFVAYVAARLFKARFAAQDVGYLFHGDYFARESLLNRLRSYFAHWLIRRADAVRVMSVRTEQAMIQRFGVKAERIVRFPFRVDDQFLRHEGAFSEEERTLINNRPYFLIPARFVGIKRIGMAIRAFAQIAARHPDVLLVLIGKGPLEETFRAQVASLGLVDRVLFRSWSQALYAWYHQALATLVVSDCEGYAMTTLESLVSGTPVVMTDVGCAPEVIREGENGYIIPVGDEAMLVQRLEDVLTNRDRLKAGAGQFSYTEPANGMKELLEKAAKSYPQG